MCVVLCIYATFPNRKGMDLDLLNFLGMLYT